MVFLDLFLNMMLQTNKMDSKNNNILLFALAGFGLYYFFQKKMKNGCYKMAQWNMGRSIIRLLLPYILYFLSHS